MGDILATLEDYESTAKDGTASKDSTVFGVGVSTSDKEFFRETRQIISRSASFTTKVFHARNRAITYAVLLTALNWACRYYAGQIMDANDLSFTVAGDLGTQQKTFDGDNLNFKGKLIVAIVGATEVGVAALSLPTIATLAGNAVDMMAGV